MARAISTMMFIFFMSGVIISMAEAWQIKFPSKWDAKVQSCSLPSGKPGQCKALNNCDSLKNLALKALEDALSLRENDITCGPSPITLEFAKIANPYLCCDISQEINSPPTSTDPTTIKPKPTNKIIGKRDAKVETCRLPSGKPGQCKALNNCESLKNLAPEALNDSFSLRENDIACGPSPTTPEFAKIANPYLCCDISQEINSPPTSTDPTTIKPKPTNKIIGKRDAKVEACRLPSGKPGQCKALNNCESLKNLAPEALNDSFSLRENDIACGPSPTTPEFAKIANPYLCCDISQEINSPPTSTDPTTIKPKPTNKTTGMVIAADTNDQVTRAPENWSHLLSIMTTLTGVGVAVATFVAGLPEGITTVGALEFAATLLSELAPEGDAVINILEYIDGLLDDTAEEIETLEEDSDLNLSKNNVKPPRNGIRKHIDLMQEKIEEMVNVIQQGQNDKSDNKHTSTNTTKVNDPIDNANKTIRTKTPDVEVYGFAGPYPEDCLLRPGVMGRCTTVKGCKALKKMSQEALRRTLSRQSNNANCGPPPDASPLLYREAPTICCAITAE